MLIHILRYLWFLEVFSFPRITDSKYKARISCPKLPTFYHLFTLLGSETLYHPSDQPTISILRDIYESLADGLADVIALTSPTSLKSSLRIGLMNQRGWGLNWHAHNRFTILMNPAVWRISFRTRAVSFLLLALKQSLEKTKLSEFWLPIPGTLLWYLLVGIDRAYDDKILYPWFASGALGTTWSPTMAGVATITTLFRMATQKWPQQGK
jgi:hypothetical protein